jgi:predicted dehydrogenase
VTQPVSPPIRVGFLGLGQIFELAAPPYRDAEDATVVALYDVDPDRVRERGADWPDAKQCTSLDEFLATDMDLVEILVPTPLHAEVAIPVLDAGFHVNLQKPIASTLEQAVAIREAAQRNGRVLRIMEDYLFFEPLVRMKAAVESGRLGAVAGVHMKMVGTGLGGWDVPVSSWMWQLEAMREGRGILVFDDGWHKFAVAHWLFGPIARVFAWIGKTELGGGYFVDAPTTVAWEHDNGVRGVFDITFAPETYFRSDYYTCDERFEVTCTKGFARVNRVTARGIQEPSLEVYADGELTSYHALADDLAASFRASNRNMLDHLTTGASPLVMTADDACDVLAVLMAAYRSTETGGFVDVDDMKTGILR